MNNPTPLRLFKTFHEGKLFLPRYKDYSFGNISPTIEYLLTGKTTGNLLPKDCFGGSYPKPKKVVLILIDSFGYKSWKRFAKKIKPLAKVIRRSLITPLSTLFPSTTASSITSLCLGQLPSRHSLFAWNLYIEQYGEIIQPLLFSPLGTKLSGACLDLGYDPHCLISYHRTIYQRLKIRGVSSYCFIPSSVSGSVYNREVYKGTECLPFRTVSEGLLHLKSKLIREESGYFQFYWDHLDAIGHVYGPHSPEYEAEAASFWLIFEHIFKDYNKEKDTLFLFTADHGQDTCLKMYYLNLDYPGIEGCLKRDKNGQLLIPYGEARAVFIQVKETKVKEVLSLLKNGLRNKAGVFTAPEVLKLGVFGPPPYHPSFIKRLGQVIILPYAGQCVGWYIDENTKVKIGYHGGLTEEEALTQIVVW